MVSCALFHSSLGLSPGDRATPTQKQKLMYSIPNRIERSIRNEFPSEQSQLIPSQLYRPQT